MCVSLFFQAITKLYKVHVFNITIYAHKYISGPDNQLYNVISLVVRCGLFHLAI